MNRRKLAGADKQGERQRSVEKISREKKHAQRPTLSHIVNTASMISVCKEETRSKQESNVDWTRRVRKKKRAIKWEV